MFVLIDRLMLFICILVFINYFVFKPLKNIFQPYLKVLESKNRIRVAEAELEAAKNERKVTELEIQSQEEISKSIHNLTGKQ